MLEREIEVVGDDGMPCHQLDQARPDLPRIQVVQAETSEPFDIGDVLHELLDRSRPVVASIGSEVLCDEHDLGDASGHEMFDLADDAVA